MFSYGQNVPKKLQNQSKVDQNTKNCIRVKTTKVDPMEPELNLSHTKFIKLNQKLQILKISKQKRPRRPKSQKT